MSGIVGGNLGRGSGLVKVSAIDDNAVTLAKMAGLARGNLIYGDTSGDPAALAVGGADEVLTHDGTDFDWAAAAGGGGKILQVVGMTTTTHLNNTTTTYAATPLTQAITPSATSSKIYVSMASIHAVASTTQNCQRGRVDIYRDIGGGGFSSLWDLVINLGSCGSTDSLHETGWTEYANTNVSAIDSPSTTSAVTYTMYIRLSAGSSVNFNPNNNVSSVVLMEIDGS